MSNSHKAFTLAAGAGLSIYGKGAFVYVESLTAGAYLYATDDRSNERHVLYEAEGFELRAGEAFDAVYVENPTGGAISGTLVIGFGRFIDNRSSVGGVVATAEQSGDLETVADQAVAATTTALVLAADADRRAVLLSNPANNPGPFRVGDSNAGAARGLELPPGERVRLVTTGAVYAYNPQPAAMSLNVLSEV